MRAISNNIRYIIVVVMAAILLLGLRSSVWAATLSLTPNTASAVVSGVFSVEILLDAQGATIDGADIVYLHYDPSLLEIQDDDASASGIQIAAGTLMPNTVTNSVDAATGRIAFSQVTNTDESFTGSGTLATVRFKILASGTANLNFNFTPGDTSDTNVAYDAVDLLTSVGNASYALTIPPPPTQFPVLSLSPVSDRESAGAVFPVRIYLDTKGRAIDGVDISLNYDRANLAVADDGAAAGVQITPGALLPNTTLNSADQSAGRISFSQTTSGGATFTGSGVLATIYFKALAEGVAPVTFNFVKGRTTDTNVSLGGADLLDSVINGIYTITSNGSAPIISNPQPTGVIYLPRTLSLKISTNEAATCRYGFTPGTAYDSMPRSFRASSDGLAHMASLTSGFQLGRNNFYVRCRDKDMTPMTGQSDFLISFDIISDTVAPFISNPSPAGTFFAPRALPLKISTNEAATCRYGFTPGTAYDSMPRSFRASSDGLTHTASLTSGFRLGQNTIYARCRDRSGVNSDLIDFPISFTLITAPKLVASLEGLPNPSSVNVTVVISRSGTGAQVATFSDRPDSAGMVSLPDALLFSPGSYDFVVSAPYYLRKKIVNINLTAGAVVQLPTLGAGDLNSDGIVNSLDWSIMKAVWARSSASADVNKDRIVNSADWGYLRKNWLKSGD